MPTTTRAKTTKSPAQTEKATTAGKTVAVETTRQSAVADVSRKQTPQITFEQVAQRAYLLWHARGYQHGHHLEDWLKAEQELKAQSNN